MPAPTAIGIAASAAKPTLESLKEAVGSARAVQLELKKAVKDFRREWLWVVAALLGAVMLAASIMGYLAVVWQHDELTKVMATRDKLQAEVNALQEQAEQARRNNGRKPAK